LAWFFGGFFQEAGKDAYVRLKRLRERAAQAPSAVAQAVGEVQVRSAAGGPAVELGSAFRYDDGTEDAVDALRRLDWERFESGGVLRWSPERRAWSLEDD
jgi:hypothetical protein